MKTATKKKTNENVCLTGSFQIENYKINTIESFSCGHCWSQLKFTALDEQGIKELKSMLKYYNLHCLVNDKNGVGQCVYELKLLSKRDSQFTIPGLTMKKYDYEDGLIFIQFNLYDIEFFHIVGESDEDSYQLQWDFQKWNKRLPKKYRI